MIRLLRQGNPILQVLVIAAVAALPYLIGFPPGQDYASGLSLAPLSLMNLSVTPVSGSVFMAVVLLLTAVLLNLVMRRYRLVNYKSALPGFFLAIAVGTVNGATWVPDLFAGLLVLTAVLFIVLTLPEGTEGYQELFLSSFLLGLMAYIDRPFMYGFLFLFGLLFVYRTYQWRYLLIILIGSLTAHLFMFTWYFWVNRLPDLVSYYESCIPGLHFTGLLDDPYSWGPAVLITVLSLIAIGSTINRLSDNKIIIRGHLLSLIWMSFFFLVTFLVYPDALLPFTIYLTIPLAMLLGVRLDKPQQSRYGAFAFYLLSIAYAASYFLY